MYLIFINSIKLYKMQMTGGGMEVKIPRRFIHFFKKEIQNNGYTSKFKISMRIYYNLIEYIDCVYLLQKH